MFSMMLGHGIICLEGQLESLGGQMPPRAPPWIKPCKCFCLIDIVESIRKMCVFW